MSYIILKHFSKMEDFQLSRYKTPSTDLSVLMSQTSKSNVSANKNRLPIGFHSDYGARPKAIKWKLNEIENSPICLCYRHIVWLQTECLTDSVIKHVITNAFIQRKCCPIRKCRWWNKSSGNNVHVNSTVVFLRFSRGRLWSNHVCSSENNISYTPVSFLYKLFPATLFALK